MNETILVVDDEREIADLLWDRSTSTSPCLT